MWESLNSVRIAYENWEYEDRFDHLIRLLKEHRGGITETALFTSATHSPLTWDEFSRRIGVIEKRMPKLREADSMTFPRGYKKLMSEATFDEFRDKEVGEE